MIVQIRTLLASARARGSAVGAFTCYTLETAVGVLRAAELQAAPVILLVSERSFALPAGDRLVAALRAVAERAEVPAAVQLDHVEDLALIRRAFAAGVQAVMADGSRLSYAENVAFVRAAAAVAADAGGDVEAELGRIEGDEDIASTVAAGAMTDPDEAAAFVAATGVACLAVSIGNVHGEYAEPPRLDWRRLAAIRNAVAAPLSLHGASGLADADIARAVAEGIAKVNVNTELRTKIFDVLADNAARYRHGACLLELVEAVQGAVADVAGAKIRLYSGTPSGESHLLRDKVDTGGERT